MCGIVGNTANKDIRAALQKVAHRGPDDQGTYEDHAVRFGHTRLAIIDLSQNGHQPMVRENSVLVHNGEIYNFRDLGYESTSDTEVILKGYQDEGTSFFSKLRGMWAFVLYDGERLVLSRDLFGIKPLYYSIKDDEIYFASELKSMKEMLGTIEPNTEHYYQFFNLGYFIAPQTCYEGVYKVMPGEIITWDLREKKLSTEVISIQEDTKYAGFEETVEQVEQALQDSVEAHFVSDVPVGLLLSGGTDSSLIAALSASKKPIAYTLEIEGSPDSTYAKHVSKHLGLQLKSITMSEAMLEEQYEKMLSFLDEPTGDISLIPTSLIYSLIQGKGKVVLSGEGGDELFGGYIRHRALSGLQRMRGMSMRLPYGTSRSALTFINPMLSRLRNMLERGIVNVYLRSVKIVDFPIETEKIQADLHELYKRKGVQSSPNLFFDRYMYLPDNLMSKTDISSMASSIEARVPFLDKHFLSFVLQRVHPKFCLSPRYREKVVLKKILEKYLPKDVVYRSKKGFAFSFEKYAAEGFKRDAKHAIRFHREHAERFGLEHDRALLHSNTADILIKKYPRFVFALITNWKIFS